MDNVKDAETAAQYASGCVSIDLSHDNMASLHRWLTAITVVIMNGFILDAFIEFYQSISAGIGSLIYVFAGMLLVCGISRGARWARISTYVLVMLKVVVALVSTASELDVVLGILSIVPFGLASLMMLLPKVSRALKDLGRNSKPTGLVCVVFWLLFLISGIIVAIVPADKGLRDFHIHGGELFVASMVLSPLFLFCAEKMVALIDGVTGGAASPAEVVSSKVRDATCPKCRQVIRVPDTDDNDSVTCPSCKKDFYPFGNSAWAELAVIFGILSLCVLLAPLALLFGWLALKDIKANRGKHGITLAWVGIVLGVIAPFLLIIVIIATIP